MSGGVIDDILETDGAPTEAQLLECVNSYARMGARSETERLDFKVDFDESTKAWCELLKDVVCMANAGGGLLVFGVDRDGKRVGCASRLTTVLDPAAIIGKLRKYAPQVSIQANPHAIRPDGPCTIVVLVVKRADRIIVFEKDGQYEDPVSHQSRTVFYAGVVYTRTAGGNTPARQMDLDQLVNYFAEQHIHRMVARIGQVAALPPGADLIATDPADPSQGYRLLDKGLGLPVRIVPEGEEWSLALKEISAPHVPYSDVNAEIAAQVRHWRQASASHRVDRHTLARWYFDRHHVNVDENAFAFCVASASHMYGFPMYWAALLPRERLRAILQELIRKDEHPDRTTIPYLIAAFFWPERADLLTPLLSNEKVGIRTAAQRLATITDYRDFVLAGRYRAETFRLDGIRYRLPELASNRSAAQTMFEDLIRRDLADELGAAKQVAYQLDILLHAPTDEE